jgi:hypothetical protein
MGDLAMLTGSSINWSSLFLQQWRAPSVIDKQRIAPGRKPIALVRDAEYQRDGSDENEADGPGRIQIEPTSRCEFGTETAADEPRQTSAGNDHRGGVDDCDQHRHGKIGIDDGSVDRVAFEVYCSGRLAKTIEKFRNWCCGGDTSC